MNNAQRLKRIVRYLERHADLERLPLEGDGGEGVEQVVVIPVYDEADSLPKTLESLARNPAEEIARTLVICVVNQREDNPAESNAATLDWLRRRVDHDLRLAWVDAAS